jgi:single-strand DNA-binding protein
MSLPTLSGIARLIADPELRYSASGTAVCKLRLAFNSRRKDDQTGQWVDADSYFVDGTVFKQEAENVAEALTKGMEVAVVGRLKTRHYETKEGEKRSATDLMVDAIGPSLKFATARVQKMQRGSNGASPQGGGFDDPWASSQPAPANAGGFDDTPPF